MLHVQHLTNQREAVGMHAVGSQTDEHIAGHNVLAIQNLFLVHHTHREAGKIIFVLGIEAGHLSSLAADQCAACLPTSLGNAGNNLLDPCGIVLAACHIVQEEHGAGAGTYDIVDTHGNTVDANGVVLVHQKCNFQLGANTIGAGNHHRLLHAGHIRSKQAAEAAQTADNTGDIGALHQRLNAVDRLVAGGYVYTSSGVAVTFANTHNSYSPEF